MTEHNTTAHRERGEAIRVESISRPGFFHFVSEDLKSCSCEAKVFGTVEVCGHMRRARIRAAKSSPQRTYTAEKGGKDKNLEAKRVAERERIAAGRKRERIPNEMVAANLDRMEG